MKRSDSSTAPRVSTRMVTVNTNRARRMMPPIWGAAMDSCMTKRDFKPMRRLDSVTRDIAMVIKPRPPIWMRIRMTACPNSDQ